MHDQPLLVQSRYYTFQGLQYQQAPSYVAYQSGIARGVTET